MGRLAALGEVGSLFVSDLALVEFEQSDPLKRLVKDSPVGLKADFLNGAGPFLGGSFLASGLF